MNEINKSLLERIHEHRTPNKINNNYWWQGEIVEDIIWKISGWN